MPRGTYVPRQRLQSIDALDETLRVFVDISSHSRAWLAEIVGGLDSLSEQRPIEAVFGYSLASYQPTKPLEVPNVEIGPISDRFAGWTQDPERPLALIIGLGYEQDRALGAVEFLEPAQTWALMPRSSLPGYGPPLRQANSLLVESISVARTLYYDVEDPNATYAKLTSLILHASRNNSVILLPGGPKVLALLTLLTAIERRDIAVWRVSAGAQEHPIDRKASGRSVFVRHTFASVSAGLVVGHASQLQG